MTSTTNKVNFSVRQNKAIERAIVFDGIRDISRAVKLSDQVYVGFGSVWFVDFEAAHAQLGVQTLFSIEKDPVVYARAEFNKPYRCIQVLHGYSREVIGELLDQDELASRPWIVWLDYDQELDEDCRDEIADMVRLLPRNSFILATVSAQPAAYGSPTEERLGRLKSLFGRGFDEERPRADVKTPNRFMTTLASTMEDHLKSVASRSGVSYLPAFYLPYQDGTPMVTVGGFLPDRETEEVASHILGTNEWQGRVKSPIATPPLTPREVISLRAQLPRRGTQLTRDDVQGLGFDLQQEHLDSFVRHYLRYPSYAQLAR